MLNQSEINHLWKEIKGGIKGLWDIPDEEIENAHGNINAVATIVQNKFGESQTSIDEKLNRLLDSFDNETDKTGHLESSYMRRPDKIPEGHRLSHEHPGANPHVFSKGNFEGDENGIDYDSKEIFDADQKDLSNKIIKQ